ncbi:hypothetical protein K6Y56_29230, partial [Burkholderia cenocepacia]|nr:hypothetical protein [Burkholderia cenocepacia]MCW3684674.1 hypothetical protein [Burkholderia cenocepacia]MCW3739921.1 hypothetical protein [Burkholderia cenocepacia]
MDDMSGTLAPVWRVTILTLAITIGIYAELAAAEWLASCLLYASVHLNPLRAGWSTWLDALGVAGRRKGAGDGRRNGASRTGGKTR